MLEFNLRGFLTPGSIIRSNIDEFKEHFVAASAESFRKNLFDQYTNYTKDLKVLCDDSKLVQWIDGSFVTKKPNPSDIDLVTFINLDIFETKEKELKRFIYPSSLTNYGVDGYLVIVYPENHRHYSIYESDRAYWINQFDKTKPTRRHRRMPKGFLEIIV